MHENKFVFFFKCFEFFFGNILEKTRYFNTCILQCKYTTRYYAKLVEKYLKKSQFLWKDFWNFLWKFSFYIYIYIYIIKTCGLGQAQTQEQVGWYQPKMDGLNLAQHTLLLVLFLGTGWTWPNQLGWAKTGPAQSNLVTGITQWLSCTRQCNVNYNSRCTVLMQR
jgi:hypothetical protein